MATTNLISKSLGDLFLESGNGSPDHTSPKGSLYVDQDSGIVYQNLDGGTVWQLLNTVAYGEGYYQTNTIASTISVANTWVSVVNNFTLGDSIGVSASGGNLVINTGYEGKYEVRGDVTISYVAGTNNYEVGLSVNGANPVVGAYNGALVDVTYTRQHIGFESIVSATGSTTLGLSVRNLTAGQSVIIRHANLFVKKVS